MEETKKSLSNKCEDANSQKRLDKIKEEAVRCIDECNSNGGVLDLEPEGSNGWAVKTIINIDGPKKKKNRPVTNFHVLSGSDSVVLQGV